MVDGTFGLDRHDAGVGGSFDAGLGAAIDEELDEVRVESLEWASAIDDAGSAPGACGDVGEFEGDETSSDEKDPFGKLGEIEECGAVDEMVGAGKIERSGSGSSSDEEVVRGASNAVDVEAVRPGELCGAVQGVDPVAGEAAFHVRWDWLGESEFVFHEIGPVDVQAFGVDPLAAEEACAVDDLGAAPQDILRVTSPQCACAAVGKLVDDRYAPPR